MLPNLLAAKEEVCDTFIDVTPLGCGRSISILQKCSKASQLHIITNTGSFLDFGGKYISPEVKEKTSEELAEIWEGKLVELVCILYIKLI